MKKTLIVIRWIVGLLFIFSGLIKANDPLGLSYKMQEFFEAWGWNNLNNYTLALAIVMNVFEVLAGVAVIIGWRMKTFSWLLLLLIIFFSFLTGYALLSGKIKTCGCFGDCLPLTPLQSFIKDIFLLLLILILFVNKRKIISSLISPLPQIILLVCILIISSAQMYVLQHLPFIDCLGFKVGKNIPEQMKIPAGAVADSFSIVFKYKKNGKEIEFDQNNFPADFDSTYEYVDRYDKLVRKGNAAAPIADFALQNLNGKDTTLEILNQGNYYIMLMAKDFSTVEDWRNNNFQVFVDALSKKNIPFFLVTSDKNKALELFSNDKRINILVCDGTVMKTAARVNPTYFIMQQGNIKGKYSYANFDEVQKQVDAIK